MKAIEVFAQNDGIVTKAYYAELEKRGPAGRIAVALFRCQKRSTAAKRYRGGRYRRAAYDVKNWSLEQLCHLLHTHGSAFEIRFGWKVDPALQAAGDPHCQVLYVDLPQGQASFHSERRYAGSEYEGEWDGQYTSQERILSFCDQIFSQPEVEKNAEQDSVSADGANANQPSCEAVAECEPQTEARPEPLRSAPPTHQERLAL
jgi:hypothetical protein